MATEKLQKKLCEQCNRQFSNEPCEPSECYLLNAIEDAVEVVHGEWEIEFDELGWLKHTCSVCGFVKRTDIHVSLGWNYCPKCGAKMALEV